MVANRLRLGRDAFSDRLAAPPKRSVLQNIFERAVRGDIVGGASRDKSRSVREAPQCDWQGAQDFVREPLEELKRKPVEARSPGYEQRARRSRFG